MCSPWHALMNATFVVVGVALAMGPVLSRRALPPLAVVLLVVAGVSSAGVGLAPLDTSGGLHTLVALPLFVTQPLALLLLGSTRRRGGQRGWGIALLGSGALALAGAVAFGFTLVASQEGGLYVRIALWPCHLGLAVLGVALWRGVVWENPSMADEVRAR